MTTQMVQRPILLISNLASNPFSYLPSMRGTRNRMYGRQTTMSDPVRPALSLSASVPDLSGLLGGSVNTIPMPSGAKSARTVGLSRKKAAMAHKMLDEALAEDSDGDEDATESAESQADFTLHLFNLALASLLSALPRRALEDRPEATNNIRSTLLTASDTLGLGLVDGAKLDEAAYELGRRDGERAGTASAPAVDVKERIVGMLVSLFLWIRWSEIPVILGKVVVTLLAFAQAIEKQYGVRDRAYTAVRSMIGGPAFSALITSLGILFTTLMWIATETVRRVATSGPPPYEARPKRA